MRLPDWEDKRIERYRDRWEKCRGLGADAVFKGLARLLYTQPSNPPSADFIRYLQGSRNREDLYTATKLPKKRGGSRSIHIPSSRLRWLQRSILLVFTHLFPRHKCAHGFERGHNIVTHAEQHCGKRFVYTVDIKDFFPSITWGRIYGMLQAFPFRASPDVARVLANLVTYRGILPQGAPTSPILANLLCRQLDSRLFKWARQNGYTYSRYADDLTFSTNRGSFPESDQYLIRKTVEDEGFELNPDKKRLMPWYTRQMVTGLVVNERPNLPREYIRGLRALLFNIKTYGWESQVDRDPLFAHSEDWQVYQQQDLPAEQFENLRDTQRRKRLLVRPDACLPKVHGQASLQRVLQGKIEFLGLVKGRDAPLYLKMRQQFDALVTLEKGLETGRRSFAPAPVASKPDGAAPVRSTTNPYATYKRIIDLPDDELRAELKKQSHTIVEYEWLLQRAPDSEELRSGARAIAYSALTSPEQVARFFKEFDSDRSFRGLLHDPTQNQAPAEIIGSCEEALKRYENRIPNALSDRTAKVLRRCRLWFIDHEDQHPWRDNNLRQGVLLPYVRDTRIDNRRGYSLKERLHDEIAQLKERYGKEIALPRRPPMLRTFVPDVLEAVKHLLRSMAQHSKGSTISIDMERKKVDDSFSQITLRIHDDVSCIEREPEMARVLKGGDTRRALPLLRGYADWYLTAPFDGGGSYRFDVMRNGREPAEPATSVRHELIFIQ